MKSEKKKPTNLTLTPSVVKEAKKKAKKQNPKTSVSEVADKFLKGWIAILIILFLASCATQNGCQQNRNFIGYHSK